MSFARRLGGCLGVLACCGCADRPVACEDRGASSIATAVDADTGEALCMVTMVMRVGGVPTELQDQPVVGWPPGCQFDVPLTTRAYTLTASRDGYLPSTVGYAEKDCADGVDTVVRLRKR